MIQIEIKSNEFAYDLRSLAMAFFPGEQCRVTEYEPWRTKETYPIRCQIDGRVIWEADFPVPYEKNQVKRRFYRILSGCAKKELPWGILTGVRPSKIPLRMLREGVSPDDIKSRMAGEYLCRSDKVQLALDVAVREHELTAGVLTGDGISLYIGIPFCPSICAYCSFSSYPVKQYEDRVDLYLDALEKEMVYVSEKIRDRKLHSVYVGGGTPTALTEAQFSRLLAMVKACFPTACEGEYTVEAGRPDSITEGKLRSMKEYGVGRISVNPQTMKQRTLERLGRHHTVEQVKEACRLARQAGFENINMDLIVGLPGETMEDFRQTLEEVWRLQPDSVTVHTLVIKRASRMRREQMEQGDRIFEEDGSIPLMQECAERFCRERGLNPYYMYRQKNKASSSRNTNQENVAYARAGKECLYNILMMEELETIIALGSGGSSKVVYGWENRVERIENVKSVDDYISRINEMIERKEKIWH